jgi:hypothetical protein
MGIKHVVAGVAVVAGGLLLTGCERLGTTFEDTEAVGQDITELRFANDSGDVTVSTGDKTEIERTVHYNGDKPGETHRVDGDALIIRECPVEDCTIDYRITVPEGTKVSGRVESGTVEVTGAASANIQSESGDITARDIAGEVNASAQSGDLELTGVGGAVVADAQSGGVTVGLTAAQSVLVETQSGDIDVTVPSAKYHVKAATQSGDVSNEVGDDPSGHKIELSAQSGNVNVRAA